MSYHVQLFSRETRARYEAAEGPGFFGDPANLVALAQADREYLVTCLEQVGFHEGKQSGDARDFTNDAWPAEALLTDTGLYLSASGENSIFEILMFASESLTDNLTKFDPQTGIWE